jgi:hypothetical protein
MPKIERRKVANAILRHLVLVGAQSPMKIPLIVCLFFLPISRHSLNTYHIFHIYPFQTSRNSPVNSLASQPPPWHHRIRCTASWNGLKRWWTSPGDDLTNSEAGGFPTAPMEVSKTMLKVGSTGYTARWCPIAKLDYTILYLGQVGFINL